MEERRPAAVGGGGAKERDARLDMPMLGRGGSAAGPPAREGRGAARAGCGAREGRGGTGEGGSASGPASAPVSAVGIVSVSSSSKIAPLRRPGTEVGRRERTQAPVRCAARRGVEAPPCSGEGGGRGGAAAAAAAVDCSARLARLVAVEAAATAASASRRAAALKVASRLCWAGASSASPSATSVAP